jgi:tetratricopeptide (TPR) repeat protein
VTGTLFDQYKAALRRGHLAALGGDLEAALEAYRDAARLVPERSLPLASQGTVLHRLDRWPEAAAAFDQALAMSPDDESALRARARAMEERGLQPGAAADYERLAFVLDVAGRAADAAAAARRAADLDPSAAREALADRLRITAAQQADLQPPPPSRSFAGMPVTDLDLADGDGSTAGAAEPASADESEPDEDLDAGVEDDTEDRPRETQAARALAARIAELGTQPAWVDMDGRAVGREGEESSGPWPAIDLPSPPAPMIEGPRPDPETLLAEAVELAAAGDGPGARDLMLTAVAIHREESRLDAALEVCLRLLAISPGDPQVHLAIANLQLDRGWTDLATEKLQLLLRLTALTGDTQAEADAHFLASERLREGFPTAS